MLASCPMSPSAETGRGRVGLVSAIQPPGPRLPAGVAVAGCGPAVDGVDVG